ncbi:MAG: FecR domain-containing protein, partial [Panacagrimonas sp.]
MRLLLPVLVGLLLAACVVPGGSQRGSVSRSAATDASPARPMYALIVTEMRGRAWVQRDGQTQTLKEGSAIGENQPIQVGDGSLLRLQLADHTLLELAPNTRLVVHRLPREGRGDARATWLRLEQGYLRAVWKGAVMDPPMQVSFGIWNARLRPGEYFFDTRGRVAAACTAGGSMRLSGVPEWTPQESSQECLRLEARKTPLAIAMTDAQWNTVRAQRRLHPTLAKAARSQSTTAIARLERDQVRSPGPRPSAAEPPSVPEPRRPVPPPAEPPVAAVPT